MTIALICNSPYSIIAVYPPGVVNVNVPGKWQVSNVTAGWKSPDGKYELVTVKDFVVPAGQTRDSAPTYSIDANGVVTEFCTTVPIPVLAPTTPAWPPNAISRALKAIDQTKAENFFAAFSRLDQVLFMTAGAIPENDPRLLSALQSVGLTIADLRTALSAR